MISATIFGRLTKEPDTRTTQSGTSVCNISIAVNHGKDAQGQDITTFVDCAAFGKTIETIQKYCRKGLRVCVSVSDMRLRRYTTQNGTQGASLDGTISKIDIVDWPDQQGGPAAPAAAPGGRYGYPGYPAAAPAPAPTPPQGGYQGYPGYPVTAPAPAPQPQYSAPPVPPAAQPAPSVMGAPGTGGWTPGGPADFPFGANAQR